MSVTLHNQGSEIDLSEQKGIIADALGRTRQGGPIRGSSKLIDAFNTHAVLQMVVGKVGDLVAAPGWSVWKAGSAEAQRDLSQLRHCDFDDRFDELNRKKSLSEQDGFVRVPNHPLLQMLRSSYFGITGRQIIRLMQIYLDMVGESGMLVQTTNPGAIPSQWAPFNPTHMQEIPSPIRPEYVLSSDGDVKRLTSRNVFFVKNPNPADPMGRGRGIAHALGDEVETDEATAKWVKMFFRNGATPPVIITDPDFTDTRRQRAESRWLDHLRGALRSWMPFFFRASKETKIMELKSGLEGGQSISLRKFQRDIIMQTFGVSPEVFGLVESANRATAREARQIVAENVVMPRLEVLRQAFQDQLLARWDENLLLDYDDPRPRDKELKIAAVKSMPWLLTVDQGLRMLGENPIGGDEGKMRALPVNMGIYNDLQDARERNLGFGEHNPLNDKTDIDESPDSESQPSEETDNKKGIFSEDLADNASSVRRFRVYSRKIS